jgi:hypothetical protein
MHRDDLGTVQASQLRGGSNRLVGLIGSVDRQQYSFEHSFISFHRS